MELLDKLKLCGIQTYFREQLKSSVTNMGEFISLLAIKAPMLFSY